MNLDESRKEFLEELRTDAATDNADTAYEFTDKVLEMLEGIGDLQEPHYCYFGKTFTGNRMMQLDGYCFDTVENSISLIIVDFEDTYEPGEINRKQIEDVLAKRLRNFLELSCNGNIRNYCDESDEEILNLSEMIRHRMTDPVSGILKVKFIILTNKKLSDKVKKIKQSEFMDKPVEINIWHIERILEVLNSSFNEPIAIDFDKDFGIPGIPCLRAEIGENLDYRAYVAIIPGKLLADIYIEYGSRVLEGNVRAFLGANGQKSVNAGIKRTIKFEPTKFFTYNNGIAATAAYIKTEYVNGQLLITELEDLQIINGGQTTASLATAILKKDSPDLDGIFVSAKITVIEDRESIDEDGIKLYDSMVQKISRYANSQNKVTAADFFSNSPFHVIMEKLSKKCFAPPVNGSLNPTGWYYERARKKYDQEQIKLTKSQKDKFQQKYPKKQIITKEKLAKYIFCIECKPHIVSKGSNWVMKEFGAQMDKLYKEQKEKINDVFFRRAVGAAILFDTVDKIVAHAPWYQKGGPKLNIVPYTISKIMSAIPKGYTVDWFSIWQKQALPPAFVREVEIVAKMANDFIKDCNGIIVTEYCKKEATWERFKTVAYTPSVEFCKILIPIVEQKQEEEAAYRDGMETTKINTEIDVIKLGSAYWRSLFEEAERMRLLSDKDSSLLKIAYSVEKTGYIPSSAQARAIIAIRDRLEAQGIFVSK